jgi:hypothetical protein
MGRDMNNTPKKKKKELGLPYDVEDNALGTYSVDSDIMSYSEDKDGHMKLPKGLSRDVLKSIVKDIVEDMFAEKKHKAVSMTDTEWFDEMERMYEGLIEVVPSMLKSGQRDEG